MSAESIIARSISAKRIPDKKGRTWQYHSRSDSHSKIACWAVLFDLLRACPLLQKHAAARKVCFGINHELRDFRLSRRKNLDLVLCRATGEPSDPSNFRDHALRIGIELTSSESAALHELPLLMLGTPSNVLLALEAKACMTEHVKARPRLYDELHSSVQTIHGDTGSALAAAFVMINTSTEFLSPGRNEGRRLPLINRHKQPEAALATLAKVNLLPRRSDESGDGFDAIGVSMVSMRNDLSEVRIDDALNLEVDPTHRWDGLVQRLAHLYSARFAEL